MRYFVELAGDSAESVAILTMKGAVMGCFKNGSVKPSLHVNCPHQVSAILFSRGLQVDALVRVGLRWPAMLGSLLRKTATLVVAYLIALQVLLSGLVVGAHATFDPFAAICGSDGAGDHHAPPPQNGSNCGACPLACAAGSPAVMPSDAKLSLVLFACEVRLSAVRLEALPSPAKHQLQAS